MPSHRPRNYQRCEDELQQQNSIPYLYTDKLAPPLYREKQVPFCSRDDVGQQVPVPSDAYDNPHGPGCHCQPSFPEFDEEVDCEEKVLPPMTKSLVPYNSGGHGRIPEYTPPLKRSMSFLTTQELFSYRAIPALGVTAYLGTAIGTITYHETFAKYVLLYNTSI